LHPVAATTARHLRERQDDELWPFASKLIGETDSDFRDPEVVSLWASIARVAENTEPSARTAFVYWYLADVRRLAQPPRYTTLPVRERKLLSRRMHDASEVLAEAFRSYDLDSTVVWGTGKLFHGYSIVEDFGESNQARIRIRRSTTQPC